jgi:esterase/lipase
LLESLPEVDSSRIALIGHSLGALASVLAAGKVKPKAIVALSCPYEVQQRLLNNHYYRAFPWFRWTVILIGRLAIRFRKLKVKVDWDKFLKFWSQVKLAPALAELGDCNKLFVFSDSDMLTPYRKFSGIYENAPGPKQKMLARGVHTTPIRAEILRFEWIGWVVSVLKA